MEQELSVLAVAALSIGFFHTLFGPDHYLPFIMMGQAQQWSRFKLMLVTFLCGLGHVLSSVLLGLLGVALGIAVGQLEAFEAMRGSLAAWALIAFGLAYAVWGIHQAIRDQVHSHQHSHADGTMHSHNHQHASEHAHVHQASEKKRITPWVLFTIFVLGPCEPLIPLLMYPAAKNSIAGLLLVTGLFSLVTVGTMLAVVAALSWGVSFARLGRLDRYTHAIAGLTIFLSGMAIQVLGL